MKVPPTYNVCRVSRLMLCFPADLTEPPPKYLQCRASLTHQEYEKAASLNMTWRKAVRPKIGRPRPS
jgi:hypothetical protein